MTEKTPSERWKLAINEFVSIGFDRINAERMAKQRHHELYDEYQDYLLSGNLIRDQMNAQNKEANNYLLRPDNSANPSPEQKPSADASILSLEDPCGLKSFLRDEKERAEQSQLAIRQLAGRIASGESVGQEVIRRTCEAANMSSSTLLAEVERARQIRGEIESINQSKSRLADVAAKLDQHQRILIALEQVEAQLKTALLNFSIAGRQFFTIDGSLRFSIDRAVKAITSGRDRLTELEPTSYGFEIPDDMDPPKIPQTGYSRERAITNPVFFGNAFQRAFEAKLHEFRQMGKLNDLSQVEAFVNEIVVSAQTVIPQTEVAHNDKSGARPVTECPQKPEVQASNQDHSKVQQRSAPHQENLDPPPKYAPSIRKRKIVREPLTPDSEDLMGEDDSFTSHA